MRNNKFIFIIVFFIGMLFTVLQYLPMIEEESPSHKIELAKLLSPTDSDGDCDSNNDSENDNETGSEFFIAPFFHSDYSGIELSKYRQYSILKYSFRLNTIQSPPPKV